MKKKIRKVIFYLLLLISAFLVFFPILYAISASLMSTKDILTGRLIPDEINFSAYKEVINSIPLLRFLFVSFTVSFIVMIGQLIVSSLSAYAFVFIPFKGRELI